MSRPRNYDGPERRADDANNAAVLERLDGLRDHFDRRLARLEEKVGPMHDYFVTAKTGATIIRWIVIVGTPVLGAWAAIKGFLFGIRS